MLTTNDPARPLYLLWCGVCGRSEGKTAAEVLGHTRSGWPKCCNQIMSYCTSAERLAATDTALDKPHSRRPGDWRSLLGAVGVGQPAVTDRVPHDAHAATVAAATVAVGCAVSLPRYR